MEQVAASTGAEHLGVSALTPHPIMMLTLSRLSLLPAPVSSLHAEHKQCYDVMTHIDRQ